MNVKRQSRRSAAAGKSQLLSPPDPRPPVWSPCSTGAKLLLGLKPIVEVSTVSSPASKPAKIRGAGNTIARRQELLVWSRAGRFPFRYILDEYILGFCAHWPPIR